MKHLNDNNLVDKSGTIHDVFLAIKGKRTIREAFLIGIDGLGGSGKTRFAEEIKILESSIEIVHLDDFYLPSINRPASAKAKSSFGSNIDFKRVSTQLIEPLLADKDAYFERYDWDTDTLAEIHMIPRRITVIIEGVYALAPELIGMYNLKVWIDCPRKIRLARGLNRDGSGQRDQWIQEWMPAEDRYVQNYSPMIKADIIINGANDFTNISRVN